MQRSGLDADLGVPAFDHLQGVLPAVLLSFEYICVPPTPNPDATLPFVSRWVPQCRPHDATAAKASIQNPVTS